MFEIISLVFKYIFIIIIYMFIFSIIRLIYLDIRGMDFKNLEANVYLKLIDPKDSLPFKVDEYYPIESIFTLGRSGQNDVNIKDRFMSKKHFKIVEDEEEYYLEDLNSKNGTELNGELIQDTAKLKNGDIIKAGSVQFLFVNRE